MPDFVARDKSSILSA